MTMKILTNGQIELDAEPIPLHASQREDGMHLYTPIDSVFGEFHFETKKKSYFLGRDSVTGEPSKDSILFEEEVRTAFECMQKVEIFVEYSNAIGINNERLIAGIATIPPEDLEGQEHTMIKLTLCLAKKSQSTHEQHP